jgi:hypothetical protein
MIDRQLRIKEAKIKAIEIQEDIIKEVDKRREVNHFRKEKLAYLANAFEKKKSTNLHRKKLLEN